MVTIYLKNEEASIWPLPWIQATKTPIAVAIDEDASLTGKVSLDLAEDEYGAIVYNGNAFGPADVGPTM